MVVGLPLSLDGRSGPAAGGRLAETEELAASWRSRSRFDERLTTVTADRALVERRDAGRARRRVVDKVAAAVMLQAWLDRRAGPLTSCRPRGFGVRYPFGP